MTDAAIISGSLVDVRNVGTHKSVKLTIHVPEEYAMKVVEAFGWPTGVNPVPVAIAHMNRAASGGRFVGADIADDSAEIPLSGGKCSRGTPAGGVEGSNPSRSTMTVTPAGVAKFVPTNEGPRKFETLPYATQAALRCREPIYWAFLREMCPREGEDVRSEEEAKRNVRMLCEVNSRADIRPDTEAETHWLELERWFDAWKTKDRVA